MSLPPTLYQLLAHGTCTACCAGKPGRTEYMGQDGVRKCVRDRKGLLATGLPTDLPTDLSTNGFIGSDLAVQIFEKNCVPTGLCVRSESARVCLPTDLSVGRACAFFSSTGVSVREARGSIYQQIYRIEKMCGTLYQRIYPFGERANKSVTSNRRIRLESAVVFLPTDLSVVWRASARTCSPTDLSVGRAR